MMFALRCLFASTMLLAAAGGIIQVCGRKWSASRRHAIWSAALLIAVLCPLLLSIRLPEAAMIKPFTGAVSGVFAAAAGIPKTTVEVRGNVDPGWTWIALTSWLVVALLLAIWRLMGFVRVAGLAAASRPHSTFQGVEVRICEGLNVPAAVAGAVILLPGEARQWPRSKLELVLRHEAAHVLRHDLTWRLAGTIACCLYWFHPLAWWAAANQREESEMACDDMVLSTAGVEATDYAGVLVEVARRSAPAAVLSMAREKGLEKRIVAALDTARPRAASGPGALFATIALGLLLLAPLSAWQEPGVQMKGSVRDIVGVIPGARLVLTRTGGGSPFTFETGEDGSYQVKGLPEGSYTLEVLKAGYQKYSTTNIKIGGGRSLQLDHYLQLGKIVETVTVEGGAAGPVAADSGPKRIRVSGNVQAAKLVERVVPKYPPSMKQAGIQGTVRMRAVIGKTGEILTLDLLMTPSQELARAALDAVGQWKYEPTLLNGNPVEIESIIDVNFTLSQ